MSFSCVARPVQGLFACVIALGLLSACSRAVPEEEPLRAVKLIEVGVQAESAEAEYAGEVRARTESSLGFQVAGKLLHRAVDAGDVVKKGQLLAELDAQDYVLAARAAQAQVAAAQTQRDLAQADWQRFSALKQKGFISEVELDRRLASLQAAQAQLDQARAQASAQGNQATYTRLLATASGVITSVMAEPGQVVAAGAPVVNLAHDGERDVVISVPERVLPLVQQGQQVQVRAWADGRAWAGSVREVAASADPVTRTYAAKVAIHGDQQPALGSTAYVRMRLAQPNSNETGLRIPTTAIMERAGQSMVWEFNPETSSVHARVIEIAGVEGNEIVLRSGVTPGMSVVATGVHVLAEGQKVSIYQAHRAQAAQ